MRGYVHRVCPSGKCPLGEVFVIGCVRDRICPSGMSPSGMCPSGCVRRG